MIGLWRSVDAAVGRWFDRITQPVHQRTLDYLAMTEAADRLADREADTEVAEPDCDPCPTLPDVWAAERAVIDLPDDMTIDDYTRHIQKPPAGAAPRPVQPAAAIEVPPASAADGAGGSHVVDIVDIVAVVAPVLKNCGINFPYATADIVAREIAHHYRLASHDDP